MEAIPTLFSFKYLPYFIQRATIKGVQILYRNEAFGYTWDVDLSLLLEIHKKDGSTFEYQLNVRGNFKKDSMEKIIGWGSCFKVQKLFQCLNINGVVNSDGTVSQSSLDSLVNKEVYVLNYISGLKDDGSNRFQMWDILSDNRDSLENDFQQSVEKGYPKNYQPELLFVEPKPTDAVKENDNFDDFIDF